MLAKVMKYELLILYIFCGVINDQSRNAFNEFSVDHGF